MILKICGTVVNGGQSIAPFTDHDLVVAIHEKTTEILQTALIVPAELADFLCNHITNIPAPNGWGSGSFGIHMLVGLLT